MLSPSIGINVKALKPFIWLVVFIPFTIRLLFEFILLLNVLVPVNILFDDNDAPLPITLSTYCFVVNLLLALILAKLALQVIAIEKILLPVAVLFPYKRK